MLGCGLANESSSASDNRENFDKLQEKYSSTGYAQLARMIRGSSSCQRGRS